MKIEVRRKQIVLAITGASGAAYARRLLDCLCESQAHVHLVVSPYGGRLLHDELGIDKVSCESLLGRGSPNLTIYPYQDVGAKLASGSFLTDCMVVCPCSMNTLAAISHGLGNNLIDRAAAVTLKESRRLILVPREMPWSRIDLQNAVRLTDAGAVICPASPGFYMLPQTLEDLVDFVVGKILDLVGVEHTLAVRWTGRVEESQSSEKNRAPEKPPAREESQSPVS